MKQDTKATLSIAAGVVALLAVVYAASQFIVLEGFLHLERSSVERNVRRVLDALNDDLTALGNETADWASWDESYAFMQGRNSTFIEKNLPVDSFARLRLDLVLFVDRAGNIDYGRAVDFDTSIERPLPPEIAGWFKAHAAQWNDPAGERLQQGIVLLAQGPLLIAARPILTSEGTGPVAGTLLMGRFLDATEIARFAAITHLSLAVHSAAASDLSGDFRGARATLTQGAPIAVHEYDEHLIHGYALMQDIDGRPALLLRVEQPREIFQRGRATIGYFLLTLAVVAVVFAILSRWLIGKLLLSQLQARETERRYRAVVEQSGEGIILVDAQRRCLIDANAAFCRLLGYNPEEIPGLMLHELLGNDRNSAQRFLEDVLNERQHLTMERQYRRKDGSWLDVEVGANVVVHAGREVVSMVVRDITERKLAEERIRYLAHYDALTGLPNRVLLRDRLRHDLAHAQRNEWLVAVIFLDLDRFKVINDSLGHHAGDLLLEAAARRLAGAVRQGDTVSRQGGDEFVIVVSEVKSDDNLEQIAEKLLRTVAQPFDIRNQEVSITTSIGISVYPRDGADAETLLRNVDIAMYQAKERGGNGFRFFSSDMHVRTRERLDLELCLRHALERNQLYLVYQPQVDLETGRIFGMEALLRWRLPEQGDISPVKFIPLAEETGLIVPIGEWVLREACTQLLEWRRQGFSGLRVGVNLSTRQLQQRDLLRRFTTVLEETGLPTDHLDLEITESMLMDNMRDNVPVLRTFKEMGVSISIDDFGTGYSSLAYLQRLPIETLKIDRSFVRDIAARDGEAPIAKAVIALAHSLRHHVIAEGVETEEQFEFLRRHGCDAVQGYYFSKPLSTPDFTELLRSGRGLPGRVSPPLQKIGS